MLTANLAEARNPTLRHVVIAAAVLLAMVAAASEAAEVFTPPAALNANAGSDAGDDWEPQLATNGAGDWLAVWRSSDSLGDTIDTDWDILFARSADNGASWTAPAPLNTNAAGDLGDDREPQLTTDGAGNWVAVWRSNDSLGDTIDTDWDILFARSADNGASWTAPAALNANAASDAGNDWDPQLTTDGVGNWVAIWSSNDSLGNTIDIDWDILTARSTDSGATWTAPAALNTNAAGDLGDDWDPQLATSGAGDWVAVWRSNDSLGNTIDTDWDILTAGSTDNGTTWTAPAALNTNAGSDSGVDWEVQITAAGAGNWVKWVAVWRSDDSLGGTIGIDWDILLASSVDNGASWTAPAALNTNAAGDLGEDWEPQLTTGGAGHLLAVWRSNDSLGDTIDTDWDILVALDPSPSTVPTLPPWGLMALGVLPLWAAGRASLVARNARLRKRAPDPKV